MYDEKSTSLGHQSSPMNALSRSIFEKEFHRPLKRPPMVLIGGLKAWKAAIGDDGVLKRVSPTSSAGSLPAEHAIRPEPTGSTTGTSASEEETFLYDRPAEVRYPPADKIQPQNTGSVIRSSHLCSSISDALLDLIIAQKLLEAISLPDDGLHLNCNLHRSMERPIIVPLVRSVPFSTILIPLLTYCSLRMVTTQHWSLVVMVQSRIQPSPLLSRLLLDRRRHKQPLSTKTRFLKSAVASLTRDSKPMLAQRTHRGLSIIHNFLLRISFLPLQLLRQWPRLLQAGSNHATSSLIHQEAILRSLLVLWRRP